MPVMRSMLAILALIGVTLSAHAEGPTFKKHDINPRSQFEAAGAFDVDNDGVLDIVSGDTWYKGPDFKTSYKVRDVSRTGTYLNCFATLPVDVNADGKMDYVTNAYFTRNIGWVENPGVPGKLWTYHEIDLPGNSEAAVMLDLNGDGTPEFLPNPGNVVVYYKLENPGPNATFKRVELSKTAAGHGIGTGDLNGDGRLDIITPKGWFEAPVQRETETWLWHPEFNLGTTGIQILGRDIDGDGLADLVYGMGHNYGLFWIKQGKGPGGEHTWGKPLSIDPHIVSVHTLLWADLDGDGKDDELVTGKRVYAHEKEAGDTDASVIAWYRYDRDAKSWTRHVIYEGQPARDAPADPSKRDAQKDFPPGTAGTGLQVHAIDLDHDGDIDLVCPGKSGLYWFENMSKSK